MLSIAALMVSMTVAAPPSASIADCAVGAHTILAVEILERPRMLHHEQSIGRDRLVLRTRDNKTTFSKETTEGHWRCLGYDRVKGRYLVGLYHEVGAWLVVSPIFYLAEDEPRLEPSAFSRKQYLALASVASPSGRYLAFVGGVGGVDGLYVLDSETDTVRRVGSAPAPAPVPDFACDEPFEWGTCWADGYEPLEPAVLHFDGDDTLCVSRGRDTHKRRAKKRVVQRVKL